MNEEQVNQGLGPQSRLETSASQPPYQIVLHDLDEPRFREAVHAYLRAFGPTEDVHLHVLGGKRSAQVEAWLRAVIQETGYDPEQIPDITLSDLPSVPADLPTHLQGADLVIGSPRIALMARDLALPALVRPTSDELALARDCFKSLDWAAPAIPCAIPAGDSWLVSASSAWEAPLTTFLEAKGGDRPTSLLLRVEPGQGEAILPQVLDWLRRHGHDPEQIPDVLLIEDEVSSEISVLRVATAWFDNGVALDRAVARALGLRLLSADQHSEKDVATPAKQYRVSAIVSAYNSERFLAGCLEDLEAQTIASELEVIVIDSGSPQNERKIVREFQQWYDNIKYIRTEERETIYQAWNRGVRAATGRYLTNANTDDRRRDDCIERLVELLERHPDKVLAYGDAIVTYVENESFADCTPAEYLDWPDFDRAELLEHCYVGPQPVWRASVHEEFGFFDEAYRCSGDYEFWLRLAEKHAFIHLKERIGLYWMNDGSISRNGMQPALESEKIKKLYQEKYQGSESRSKAPARPQSPALPRELSRAHGDKPTICLVIHDFPPHSYGGAELYVFWFAQALRRKGHRVIVFHPVSFVDLPDYELQWGQVEGLDVVTVNRHAMLPEQKFGDPRLDQIFGQLLIQEGVHLVHFHHLCSTLSPSLIEATRQLGIPAVLTLHDAWLVCERGHAIDYMGVPCSGPESPEKCAACIVNGDRAQADGALPYLTLRNHAMRRAIGQCDLVTAPSDYLRRLAERASFVPPSTVAVMPLGLEGFHGEAALLTERPAGRLRLGAFGNFKPFGSGLDLKGAGLLLEAFQKLQSDRIELHIFGTVTPPWKDALEALSSVTLHGPYLPEERASLFATLDGVIIPSLIESYSLVAREAFMAGLPVIAARTGGLPEVVAHERNGLLFEVSDARDLLATLERLSAQPALLDELKSGVEKPLSIDDDARQWAERYAELVGELSPPETDRVISVVIATYNRRTWLEACLEGFCHQTLPPRNFEIIVIDDHSSEDLSGLVSEFEARLPLRFFRQERNKGANAARNRGVQVARGDIILFFDDDDRPDSRLLAEHMRTHLTHPEEHAAVLGYTGWDASLAITPVMYHVTQVGKQYFSYPDIPALVPLPWHYFWTGRSSIKRQFLLTNGCFDEGFTFSALDDIELAYRLSFANLTVYYNPKAIGYALRPLALPDFCARWEKQGRGAAIILQKHPTPELAAHFNLTQAATRLEQLEPLLAGFEAEIAQLEGYSLPRLRATAIGHLEGQLISAEQALHGRYQAVFEAFRLRGFLEAQRTSSPPQEPLKETRNVLIVAPELPMHDRSSGSFRLFQIVKLLREAGHHVTFIARAGAGEFDARPYVEQLTRLGVEVYPVDPEILQARAGLTAVSWQAILSERFYHVAYFYFYGTAAQYMEKLRQHSPATRLIVDSVDFHFLRELRQAQLANDPNLMEQAFLKRDWELSVYQQADVVVAVTEADKQVLLEHAPDVAVEVVPNIHPIQALVPDFESRRDLLFVGGFPHLPNVDAVHYFCAEVWPLLAARLPEARLFLVGSQPPESIRALANDRIVVTGYVPETAPYLSSCRVSIAPLRYGAGMKGKVGEALAAGLPVVATSIAAEGMGLHPDRDVLVADTAEGFAEAVVRLYEDAGLWRALSAAGQKAMAAQYSPEAVKAKLNDLVMQAGRKIPVSIVIPVFNQLEFTKQCLEALIEHTPGALFEVVIVDNASTDGTKEFLELLSGDVTTISNERNLGFAKACNQGARAANGEVLLFLNNDTIPHPGWLEGMLRVLETDPRVGAVGSKLLFPDGTIQHAGVVFADDGSPGHWLYQADLASHPLVNQQRDFQCVTAACVAIPRQVFEQAGGFDEGYVNGYEDVDLCMQIRKAGYRIVYAPESVVTHVSSVSEGRKDFDDVNLQRFLKRWSGKILPDFRRFYAIAAGNAPTHSVVIATRDSEATIDACLKRLLPTLGADDEILVLDHNSSDRTIEIVQGLAMTDSRIKLVESLRDRGLAGGMDQGLSLSSGEYLVLLPPTALVTPTWLERAKRALAARTAVLLDDAGLLIARGTLEEIKLRAAALSLGDAFAEPERLGELGLHVARVAGAVAQASPPNGRNHPKPRVLALIYAMEPCPLIRLIYPLEEAARQDLLDVRFVHLFAEGLTLDALRPQIEWADIVIFQRFSSPQHVALMTLCHSLGKRIVFETDDDLLNLPPTSPHYAHFLRAEVRGPIETLAAGADLITVSTPPLAEELAPLNPKISVLPNVLPDQLFPAVPDLGARHRNGPVIIGYAGTATHQADLAPLLPALKRLLAEFPEKVSLVFMGCAPAELTGHPGVTIVPETPDYQAFVTALRDSGMQIGLAPLVDNAFNRSKSAIKWMEYAACGIVPVCSSVEPYRATVRDGVDGLLIEALESEAWYQQLKDLVLDPDGRERLAREAHDTVRREHMLSLAAKRWAEAYRRLVEPDQPPVSIVIPLYNKVEYTTKCLEALIENTPEELGYEVILVDNASSDRTSDLLAQLEGNVRILVNQENLGFAKACNQGAAIARGRYVLFLNNDTEPQPGWLEPLIRTLDDDPGVGAVGARLLYPDGRLQHAGVTVTEDLQQGLPLNCLHRYHRLPADHPEANVRAEVQVVTGAALMIRRELFHEVGGFDEGYWNGNEDVDLCFTLGERGWRIVYEPESCLVHHESVSGPERWRKVNENIQRLLQRWTGRIVPDELIASDGTRQPHPARQASRGDGSASAARVSIVLLGYNQLAFTKLCVESVLAHSDVPFELILVDNGSVDRTGEYFRELAARDSRVKAILNPRNEGFAVGCNQGIAAAQGDYVLFLNNDTIVPRNWLSRLIAHFQAKPSRGAVGVVSNCVSGPQQLEDVPVPNHPDAREAILAYGDTVAKDKRGEGFELPRLVGFCLMVRREALDQIGGFDPRYGIGNYEDDDLCLRILTAGFETWVAEDVYVHHFGSRTFAALGIRAYDATMDRGWELYKQKWDLPAHLDRANPYVVDLPAFDPARHVVSVSETLPADPTDPFRPGITPLELPDRRGMAFLHHPDWASTAWQDVVTSYAQAFASEDDVSLALWLDPSQGIGEEEAGLRVLEALSLAGIDPEQAPDILLIPDVLDLAGLARLYAATDCVVPAGDELQASRAMRLGLPVLDDLTAHAWRDQHRALDAKESASGLNSGRGMPK